MLSYNKYPVAQRELLAWITRNSSVKRGMPNRDAGRRSDHRASVLVGAIPQFDAEG
jgi:hypothetical protein